MDLSKVSKGGQVWAVGGLVMFISSFLTWFSVEYATFTGATASLDASGWDVGFLFCGLWAIVGLAGAVALALPAFGVAVPKLPGIAFLSAGALAALFTLLKLLIGESDPWSRSIGLFIGIIGAIGMAGGGFLMFKESGGDISDLTDMNKLKGQFGGGPAGGPPPPPPPPGMTPPPPPPPPAG